MAIDLRTLRYLVAGLCFIVILSLLYFRDADHGADGRNSATPIGGIPSQTRSPTLHRNAQGKVIGAELYSMDVSPEQIVALREHTMLKEILFYECRGIDELVDAELVKSEGLTTIHFVRSTIDDNSLARLSRMPAVEQLTLGNVDVTATGIAALGNWSKLKRLTLEGNIELSALKGLSALEQLEELEIAIGEGEARHLAAHAFPEIRRLSISDTEFGDADLALMPEWKTLEAFVFPAENVTDAGVAQLSKFPSLKELVLMDSQITGAGLGALGHLKKLEVVSLLNCKKATDRGMNVFATMPALKRLQLLDSRVTGAGMLQLAQCKSLRYVGIGETQASEEDVAKLAAELPDCEVDRIKTLPQ
ncbi:MAG: hypothetical protein GY903_29675 [Fuerstiella sp.]|nr:hypothetical protein [Fuerstiella sp.]MCP4858666.1 hypothetical protein [Fuerstiella sp.]